MISLPVASSNATATQDGDFVEWFALSMGRLLYTYLHPPLGADEISGYSWQLVMAIDGEDDGLTLCGQLSRL
jgi:hypothetical protein